MEKSDFVAFEEGSYSCITSFAVAHLREAEGYIDHYYDNEEDDGDSKIFEFTVPEADGDLYITVETYYQDTIPNECSSGAYQGVEVSQPIVDIMVFVNKEDIDETTVYSD